MVIENLYIDQIKEQREEIKHLRLELSKLREVTDQRIDTLQTGKTPSKLFYVFITTFSLMYIIGMVALYKKTTENTLIFQQGVMSLRITQTELKERLSYTAAKTDQVDINVNRIQDRLDSAVKDLRKQIREGGKVK